MTLINFWKNYGRELESLLNRYDKQESDRIAEVVKQSNHYILKEQTEAIDDLAKLKMIRTVVIEMNRDEAIDSQKA